LHCFRQLNFASDSCFDQENVTEVDVDKYVSIENNKGFSSDAEAPAGEAEKSEKKSKDESSRDGDFENEGEQ
jgi:hypothetical protein